MTDMELAEEIGGLIFDAIKHGDDKHQAWLHDKSHELAPQIIAALRRVPSDDPMSSDYIPLCGGHAETWFTGRDHLKDGMKATCVVCAFERPPSGEMVMVPREPTQAMMDAAAALCTRGDEVYRLRSLYRAMLSDAEAEGRKS